jgi:glycosyltransferase involved in cell wall biosynthesis
VQFPVAMRHGLRESDGGRPGPRILAREVSESVGTARRLARLAKSSFDLIHSNSLWAHLDCALAGRIARRPVVLELHDIVRPGLGRHVQRAAVRLASCTIAVSRAVGDSVGGRPHNLHVVSQGVDADQFRPGPPDASWRARLSSEPDEPIIGVVGRVDPEKGIRTVLQAMTMLDGPARRSHLAVVGAPARDDGSYESELKAEAEGVLGDRCRFVGPVDEVPAVLRSLDVLVNASTSEPFGLSVLEAQACGVPVIGTASGGLPEFVTDGETGLLVAPGRPDALAAGLNRLLGASGLRDELTEEARNSVVERHTIAARAETVAHLYRSLTPAQASRQR